jgi:hypothetical protein
MKRFHAILTTLGVALLGYLVWKVGPQELWRELALLAWGVLPLMLGSPRTFADTVQNRIPAGSKLRPFNPTFKTSGP